MVTRDDQVTYHSTPTREGSVGRVRRRYVEWLIALLIYVAVVGVLRIGTYDTPPTWDAAMTVWPAAIEMSQTSPSAVLQMPTYEDGGPNTHTLSLVTIATSMTIDFTGVSAAIVLGHVANILVLCLIGVTVFALVRPYYSHWEASLVGLAAITFPVMVGQSAYLYTDLPASLMTLLSLVAATRRRPYIAGIFAAVAIAIKPLAVIVIPAVWVINRHRGLPRLRSLVPVGLGMVGLVPALLVPSGSFQNSTIFDRIQRIFDVSSIFLTHSPELIVLPFFAFGLWFIVRKKSGDNVWPIATAVLVASFIGFFLTNGILTPGYFVLPRYFVLIVPAIFASAAIVMSDQRRFAIGLMVTITLFSLTTARGPFALGRESGVQPIAERSLAFVSLSHLHIQGLNELFELSQIMPVYYSHYSHYGVAYPGLNHVKGRLLNGATPATETIWDGRLESLPSRFALMIEPPWLDELQDIYDAAVDDPDYVVDTVRIEGEVGGVVVLAIVSGIDR